jgi:hypothetical protein
MVELKKEFVTQLRLIIKPRETTITRGVARFVRVQLRRARVEERAQRDVRAIKHLPRKGRRQRSGNVNRILFHIIDWRLAISH